MSFSSLSLSLYPSLLLLLTSQLESNVTDGLTEEQQTDVDFDDNGNNDDDKSSPAGPTSTLIQGTVVEPSKKSRSKLATYYDYMTQNHNCVCLRQGLFEYVYVL